MSGSSDSSHDTTVKDITEDEQFLRIRRSNDNNHGKRKSLHEEQLEDAVLDELGSPDVLFNTVQPNDTVIFKTRTTSEQGDKHSHVFMQKLKVKEKNRYKKDTNEMQSMTRDVDWGSRGSIMDEMVNNPLRSHFNGPAIDEKYSRVKATARSNTVRIDDNNTIEIANETIATDFSGFYVLFWMAVAFTICKVTLQYYEEHGDFSQSIILRYMTMNLWKVALYDIAMYSTSYFAFVIQYLCRKNVISWRRTGRDIISVYEVVFLFSNIYLPKKTFHFNWIAQIFLFLHSLVYLMKIHSYSFYNGYLWDISSELDYATSTLKKSKKLSSPQPELDILQKSIDFCEFEIRSQSSTVRFPFNVSVKNFFEFSSFPTLVYQIEYPRTKRIRWFYVFEKCCAIFGIIFVMMVVAQQFMSPVILKAKILADANLTLWEKNSVWPKLLLDLAPGFIMMFLLVWYLIWDAILNCVAELSCFADHHFYSDWWNCCSWYDFSRLWNRPVHSFLLRHVYHSSISAYHMSKVQATLFTFLLSSVFHELAMFVLFNKFRGYIIISQMSQIPFTALSNIPLLRDKKLFNNVTFWIGICLGPSMTGLSYLIF